MMNRKQNGCRRLCCSKKCGSDIYYNVIFADVNVQHKDYKDIYSNSINIRENICEMHLKFNCIVKLNSYFLL